MKRSSQHGPAVEAADDITVLLARGAHIRRGAQGAADDGAVARAEVSAGADVGGVGAGPAVITRRRHTFLRRASPKFAEGVVRAWQLQGTGLKVSHRVDCPHREATDRRLRHSGKIRGRVITTEEERNGSSPGWGRPRGRRN
jgi:hypothetical protein